MTAPIRRWSGAELLDLPAGMGQRKEGIRYDILNYDLAFAFTATHVDRENPPSIHFDANADVNRTLSGLRFGTDDAARINPLVHLVQPWWVLGDGSQWSLGVFHFADTPLDVYSWGEEFTPECYDRSVLLTQERAGTFSISVGELFITAAKRLIAEVGLTTWTAIDNSAVYATAPQTFASGTTYKTILKAICEALGYYPPYFDNDGFLRLRAIPNPISDAPPDVEYEANETSAIIQDSVHVSSNIASAPNVYRVVGDVASEGEVIGEFYVPDTAPHSVAHRGREVVKVIQNQGVQDKQAADAAAQAAYVTDPSTYVRVDYVTAPDPRADGNMITRFLSTNYREHAFGIELTPGGLHVHQGQQVWQP